MLQQVGREKVFLKTFRERLRDVFCQEWYTILENSFHFNAHNSSKYAAL